MSTYKRYQKGVESVVKVVPALLASAMGGDDLEGETRGIAVVPPVEVPPAFVPETFDPDAYANVRRETVSAIVRALYAWGVMEVTDTQWTHRTEAVMDVPGEPIKVRITIEVEPKG